MSRRIVGTVIVAFCAASQALHAQTVVNFDSLGDGASVTTQFSGITFLNAQVLTAGFSLDEIEYPAHSGNNVITDNGGPITLTFSSAISAFSGYFTHSNPITLAAFDSGGNQLTTSSSSKNNAAVSGDGTPPNELLSLSGTNIAKVVITGAPAGNSVVADDLTYTVPSSGGGGGGTGPPAVFYTLSATPASLAFSQIVGGTAPAAQQVFITISKPGVTIPYTVGANAPSWLTVQSPNVTEQNLIVSVNTAGLLPGTYSYKISVFSTQSSNLLTIPVTLNIGYTLSANPSSLTVDQFLGAAPVGPQQVFVTIKTPGTTIPYTATANSPWLTVQSSGVSEQNVTVSVVTDGLAAGRYSGAIALTSPDAVNSPVTVPVTLNLGPVVNAVVSAASFATGAVGSGSIAALFGANFTDQTLSGTTLPLPATLGGVSVTVGGLPAALYYVSPAQINIQIPVGLPAGPAIVVVSANGTTNTYTMQIAAIAPGIFLIGKYAAAVNIPGGATNGPNAGIAPGGYVEVFMTGAGSVTPPVATGVAASGTTTSTVDAKVTATIGGQAAPVLFAGLTPTLVDLVQVNLQVPAGLADGDYPVIISVGGLASNSGLLRVTNP